MNFQQSDQNVPKKILIVDDSNSVIEIIKSFLEDEYDVFSASCGEDALNLIKQVSPDLILLDIMMKGMDGYEVCREIRADRTYDFMKIIMLSSETMLKNRLIGYTVGANDYICKPFHKEELLAKVRGFLRLKTLEDQLQSLNETLNEQVKMRTAQLLDAEKLAAIGRHMAGIVHNLKNPLQVIMGVSQLMGMADPNDERIMALIKASGQMKKIIGSVLMTSYLESKEEMENLDLNQVILNQIELFKTDSHFKSKIETTLKLSNLPVYRGVYVHFSQTIGNLIKNAVDAMHDSPKKCLCIETLKEKQMIIINISDTGSGINQKHLSKIFNPFFTTKPLTSVGNQPTGTGLGLASCKEMIESYGGNILVESELGKGSTFSVLLPLSK